MGRVGEGSRESHRIPQNEAGAGDLGWSRFPAPSTAPGDHAPPQPQSPEAGACISSPHPSQGPLSQVASVKVNWNMKQNLPSSHFQHVWVIKVLV